MNIDFFPFLAELAEKPEPFSINTVSDLWTDPYVAEQMLKFHLNPEVDISSRNHRFIDRSVDWIVDKFSLRECSRIVDFGCGPGLYCQRFARRGIGVTGIDFSSNSISYAREKAAAESLEVEYVNENYLNVALPQQSFDYAQMIMCDFCAIGPKKRTILLHKMQETLKPGGRVLLDVYSATAFEQKEEYCAIRRHAAGSFWSAEPCVELRQDFKYDDGSKVTLERYHIAQPKQTRVLYNWIQYFEPEELKAEVNAAGFEIELVLGNVAGDPYDPESDEFAVVMIKPPTK